jgi:hypothetical protein
MQDAIEYDSPVANIKWDNRGFFIFTLKNTSAIYDETEAKHQFNFFITKSEGNPYKVLMDTRDSLVFPTDGAFDYFFEHNKEENRAAIIATSLPMQLLIGQMLKGGEVQNTTLFKSEEEAIDWLLGT